MEIWIHDIDDQNYFYDLVTTLAYSQFGTNELFSRGFYLQKKIEFPVWTDFVREIQTFNFPQEIEDQILSATTFTPLIFVPGFTTKNNETLYRMEPNISAAKFVADTKGRTDMNLRLTHMTILSAYERIVDKDLSDTPVFQFFRHLRNAGAHNGKFHFTSKVIDNETGELKKEASWSSFEITSSLQGTNLIKQKKDDEEAFMDQGDIVNFLLDFENQYPEIKNTTTNIKLP